MTTSSSEMETRKFSIVMFRWTLNAK